MVIVPDSDIILIKSPLKLDNNNQITFDNATAQYNYFISLSHLEYDDCTYQRKDGVIRYATGDNLRYEDLLQYNYCMYKNDSYSNKWFYAFITDVRYVNDGMTEISIETDVFQTWQFDIIYMNSFIEREHVSDDTVGLHTIPEGLETGDYIINSGGSVSPTIKPCYIIVAVTYVPENTPLPQYDARIYNNIYSGNILLAFRNAIDVSKFIKIYDKLARAEAITNIYMAPILATGISIDDDPDVWKNYTYDGITTNFAIVPYTTGIARVVNHATISNTTTLNGYTPKNNKLKVFPFCYLSIANNNGTQVDFKYEDFISNTPTFDMYACMTAGGQNALIPQNYKLNSGISGYEIFYNYGISGGKFPTCSWNTDPYTNWLTQNGVNIMGKTIDAPTSQAISGTIEALIGAGTIGATGLDSGSETTGTAMGGIGSGLSKMFNAVQENWRHSLQSPTLEGQVSNGDLCYALGNTDYTYYKMSIKQEYARIIDNFFSLYGYKVNRLATPNIHKRSNWDYIKTSLVNLEGNIPENDLNKIRALFDNGCTFWHTTTYFLDYSRTNSIL